MSLIHRAHLRVAFERSTHAGSPYKVRSRTPSLIARGPRETFDERLARISLHSSHWREIKKEIKKIKNKKKILAMHCWLIHLAGVFVRRASNARTTRALHGAGYTARCNPVFYAFGLARNPGCNEPSVQSRHTQLFQIFFQQFYCDKYHDLL